jgi:hypothetical protein
MLRLLQTKLIQLRLISVLAGLLVHLFLSRTQTPLLVVRESRVRQEQQVQLALLVTKEPLGDPVLVVMVELDHHLVLVWLVLVDRLAELVELDTWVVPEELEEQAVRGELAALVLQFKTSPDL